MDISVLSVFNAAGTGTCTSYQLCINRRSVQTCKHHYHYAARAPSAPYFALRTHNPTISTCINMLLICY